MIESMKYVSQYLSDPSQHSIPKLTLIRYIETTVWAYASLLGFPLWREHGFRLDQVKKHLTLTTKKASETIDLTRYLVRWSKQFEGCLVLEGAEQRTMRKYVLDFRSQELAQEVYHELMAAVTEVRLGELERMMAPG
jgi:hypothetical protein